MPKHVRAAPESVINCGKAVMETNMPKHVRVNLNQSSSAASRNGDKHAKHAVRQCKLRLLRSGSDSAHSNLALAVEVR